MSKWKKISINEKIKELDSIKVLFAYRKYTLALREVKKYLKKYPNDYFGLFLQAQIYRALGNFEEAAELFLIISESDSKNKYSALVELGKIKEILGETLEAVECYEEAIKKSPNEEVFAMVAAARIYRRKGLYYNAKKILAKVPKEYDNWKLLEEAKICRDLDDLVGMATRLDKIEQTDSETFNRELLVEKGRLEAGFSDYAEAVKYFQAAREGYRKDYITYRAYYEEARSYYDSHEYQKALSILEYLDKEKSYLRGKDNLLLGLTNLKIGNVDQAKKALEIAVNVCQDNYLDEAKTHLANIKLELGEVVEALNIYNSIEKRTAGIYFKKIAACIRLKRYEEAFGYLIELGDFDNRIKKEQAYKDNYLILSKLTGRKFDKKSSTYLENQIVDYSESLFLKHQNDKNINVLTDVDIDFILEVINRNKPRYQINSEILDVYEIDVEKNFIFNGQITNTIRIVLEPESENILSIYPSIKKSLKRDMINCGMLGSECKKTKVKRISQLDKFKNKYKI